MAEGTVQHHIFQHPTNYVYNNIKNETGTDKAWTRNYHSITNLSLCSRIVPGSGTSAAFDFVVLPLYKDDFVRWREPCSAPNTRQWRFETEADCEAWFQAEISSVVLSAFARWPLLLQSSHSKPPSEEDIPETADIMYSWEFEGQKLPVAVGEIKPGSIDAAVWRSGDLSKSEPQEKLSKELRG